MSGAMDLSPAQLGRLVFGRTFDGADASFVIRRATGRIAAINARAGEVLGRHAAELIGGRAHEIVVGDEVDLIEPSSAPVRAALVRADGTEVAVALTISHVDDVRTGALAAVRIRVCDDAERDHDRLVRARAELAATIEVVDEIAAPDELTEVAADIARVGGMLALRGLAGDVTARLSSPLAALESTARGLAAAVATAGVAELARLTAEARRAIDRMEAAVATVTRAARREPDPVPEWIDLGHELETAVRLAELRHAGAPIARDFERGAYGFVPRDAFHAAVAAALDAAVGGAVAIGLAQRGGAWIVDVRGELDRAVTPDHAAFLVESWGGTMALADGPRLELSVPVMIAR
jgi:hypothetical protein